MAVVAIELHLWVSTNSSIALLAGLSAVSGLRGLQRLDMRAQTLQAKQSPLAGERHWAVLICANLEIICWDKELRAEETPHPPI